MKYLVDTNVWMDVLQNRPRFPEANRFLAGTPVDELAISRFSVFSVGFFLRRNPDDYSDFVQDLLARQVMILDFPLPQISQVTQAMKAYRLDFDDAFQYAVAELYQLTLISFDTDFDRTPRGRKTPAQVMP